MTPTPETCLRPTAYVDSDAAAVRAFAARALADLPAGADDTARAVALFLAVRDGLRYDPYRFSPEAADYRASVIAGHDAGFCVPKAILLAAVLRAAGIPAALGFADVRNHLNTPKLQEAMGTDLFVYHGYVQLWLGARTFKVTPAFNAALCARFGVLPLEFDGTADALFHPYDAAGRRHMDYVTDHGLFVDFPAEAFFAAFRAAYPKLAGFDRRGDGAEGFDAGFAAASARDQGAGQP